MGRPQIVCVPELRVLLTRAARPVVGLGTAPREGRLKCVLTISIIVTELPKAAGDLVRRTGQVDNGFEVELASVGR